jgi:hypothetical protein
MKEEEMSLIILRGTIAGLSAESQQTISDIEKEITEVLGKHPQGEGMLAISLIATKMMQG